jgi:hypothetical protein
MKHLKTVRGSKSVELPVQAVSTGHSHRAPADGHEPQCSDKAVESKVVCLTFRLRKHPVGILLLPRTLARQFTTAAF